MPSLSTDSLEIAQTNLEWSLLQGSIVMVTGAGGFIGSALVEALLARHELSAGKEPFRVIAVVRDGVRAKKRLSDHTGLEVVVQDLGRYSPSLPFADYVIHAASQASPRFFGIDPVGPMLPNVLGTQQLLESCHLTNAKGFLFVSSGEVYGQVSPSQVPTRENEYGYLDPTHVRSCYAESKRCAETLCVSYAKQHGVNARIARPFHTYGPGIDLFDGRVYADFVSDIVAGRNIVMKSDGLARRAFCYVTDAVRGLLTVLLAGEPGEAYNVGNPQAEVSVIELAHLLVQLFPERGLTVEAKAHRTDSYMPSPIVRNSPNIDKLGRLGWTPVVDLKEGFTRTVRGVEARAVEENEQMKGASCS